MNTQLISWLLSCGLDEQRARMYLTLLSLGEGQAKDVANELHMNRTAVYDNLRVLEERGYVKTIRNGKRKIFVPLHPKELYKRYEQQKMQLKDLLPDFMAVYAEESMQPFVQMFTGPHAAREIFEDILETTKREYAYFSAQDLQFAVADKTYMKQWVARRVKKRIHARSLRVRLAQPVLMDPVFTEEDPYLRQIRFLPHYIDLKSTIYIYENNIGVISSKGEGAAFIIYSKDLAFSMLQLFHFLWSISMKS